MLNKVGFGLSKVHFLFIFVKLIITLKIMRFFYAFVAFLVSCASVFAQANLSGTITTRVVSLFRVLRFLFSKTDRLRAVTLRMEMEITEFPS